MLIDKDFFENKKGYTMELHSGSAQGKFKVESVEENYLIVSILPKKEVKLHIKLPIDISKTQMRIYAE